MDHQQWKQKQKQVNQDAQIPPIAEDSHAIASEHTSRYLSNLNKEKYTQIEALNIEEYKEKFQSHFIKLNTDLFLEAAVEFINISKGGNEFVQAKVSLGYFFMKILILNTDEFSPTQNLKLNAYGQFSQIYFCDLFKRHVTIKFIKFKNPSKIKETIINAVKEYTITKIASIIGCGPIIIDDCGIQLICFNDGICFFMQKGKKANQLVSTQKQSLKDSLQLLHTFHIVHNDIKPANICRFSKQEVKFIDFGLSDIVSQNRGFKSLTNFKGSLSFCSPQMEQCFLSQSHKNVDLYYNDSECLTEALKFAIKDISIDDQTQNDVVSIQKYFLHHIFKYYIFAHQLSNAKRLLKDYGSYLIQSSAKYILLSLSDIGITTQMQKLIEEDLSVFENYQIYQKIKEKIRRGNNLWDQKISLQKGRDLTQRINQRFVCQQRISFKDTVSLNFNNYTRIFHYLERFDSQKSSKKSQCIQIVSKCLTFRNSKNGLTFAQKASLAKIFRQKIMKQNPSSNELINIRQCHLFYLKFYLQLKKSYYIEKILNLVFQNLILDNNIATFIPQMESFFKENAISAKEMLQVYFHIAEILSFTMFKIKSRDMESFKKTVQFLKETLIKYKAKAMTLNNDIKNVFNLLESFINGKLKISKLWEFKKDVTIFRQFYDRLILIPDRKIFKIMKSVTVFGLLEHFLFQIHVSACMWIVQSQLLQLKETIFYDNKIELRLGINLIVRFFYLIRNQKMIINISQRVRQLLQNDELFDDLQFKWHQCFISDNKDMESLKNCFFSFLENIKHDNEHTFLLSQQIWQRIFEDTKFVEQNRDKIADSIYIFYRQSFLEQEVTTINVINRIFSKGITIMQWIFKFVPILKEKIKTNIEEFGQKMSDDLQKKVMNGQTFKYCLISAFFCGREDKCERSCDLLFNILKFAKANQVKEIMDYCYHNIIALLYILNKKQKLLQIIKSFFIFSVQNIAFHSYFAEKAGAMIFITLEMCHYFDERPLLYKFLEYLASIMATYINKKYYQVWAYNIHAFFKLYSSVFSYDNLKLYFGAKDHILYLTFYYSLTLQKQEDQKNLLKILIHISSNIQKMKSFVIPLMLQRYYTAFMRLGQLSQSKRKWVFLRRNHYIEGPIFKKYRLIIKSEWLNGNPKQQMKNIMLLKFKRRNVRFSLN